MVVCHCRAVSDGVVRAEIEAGARCPLDLARTCGAGSRCGRCVQTLAALLASATAS